MRVTSFSPASSADLLSRLRAGDERPLAELYRSHRDPFLRWAARRYPDLTVDELTDAFQEGIIGLYENVASGRLQQFTAQPSTYLFRIADRHCQKTLRKRALNVKIMPDQDINAQEYDSLSPHISPEASLADDPFGVLTTSDDRLSLVQRALQQLTPDCRRLLTAFYYHQQTLAELAEAFNYRDLAVASTRKSQCLARLRKLCRLAP